MKIWGKTDFHLPRPRSTKVVEKDLCFPSACEKEKVNITGIHKLPHLLQIAIINTVKVRHKNSFYGAGLTFDALNIIEW